MNADNREEVPPGRPPCEALLEAALNIPRREAAAVTVGAVKLGPLRSFRASARLRGHQFSLLLLDLVTLVAAKVEEAVFALEFRTRERHHQYTVAMPLPAPGWVRATCRDGRYKPTDVWVPDVDEPLAAIVLEATGARR